MFKDDERTDYDYLNSDDVYDDYEIGYDGRRRDYDVEFVYDDEEDDDMDTYIETGDYDIENDEVRTEFVSGDYSQDDYSKVDEDEEVKQSVRLEKEQGSPKNNAWNGYDNELRYSTNSIRWDYGIEQDIKPSSDENIIGTYYNNRIYLTEDNLYVNGVFMYKSVDDVIYTDVRHDVVSVDDVVSIGTENVKPDIDVFNSVKNFGSLLYIILFGFIFNYLYNLICNIKGMRDTSFSIGINFHVGQQIFTGVGICLIFLIVLMCAGVFLKGHTSYRYIKIGNDKLYYHNNLEESHKFAKDLFDLKRRKR